MTRLRLGDYIVIVGIIVLTAIVAVWLLAGTSPVHTLGNPCQDVPRPTFCP